METMEAKNCTGRKKFKMKEVTSDITVATEAIQRCKGPKKQTLDLQSSMSASGSRKKLLLPERKELHLSAEEGETNNHYGSSLGWPDLLWTTNNI